MTEINTHKPRPFAVITDDERGAPPVYLSLRDIFAKDSTARDQVFQHHGVTVAPWTIAAALGAGLVVGLLAADVVDFLENDGYRNAISSALFVLGLGFTTLVLYPLVLMVLRGIKPDHHARHTIDLDDGA